MRPQIKYTLLLVGILLTIGYVIAGGKIFPSLYLGVGDAEGNLDMMREDLKAWTLHLSALTAVLPWLMAVLFYYIINSVNFDRWWNWFIVLALTSLLSAWGGMTMLTRLMENLEPGLSEYYAPYLAPMAGWCSLFSAILFTVASFACRWWSSNCRHTPFPQ